MYYPVTQAEIDYGPRRPDDGHLSCTIPVRADITDNLGRKFPMMSWGSPVAYEIVTHNGLFYGVHRGADVSECCAPALAE